MPENTPWGMIWSFVLAKGTIVALATRFIGTSFAQSVVIALISGGLGMFGMLGAAYITSREARRNRSVMHDIKRKLGAANREMDDPQ